MNKKVSLKIPEKLLDRSLEGITSSFKSFSDRKMRARFVRELLANFLDIISKKHDSPNKIKAYRAKVDEFFSYLKEHNVLDTNDLENCTKTYDQIITDYLPTRP
ncbi:hypothetical protein J4221_01730 [Candidatus Pacearchaeota archaeon]|nr:hypothetical protein [Candidatus Pacearchaeota archaeon]